MKSLRVYKKNIIFILTLPLIFLLTLFIANRNPALPDYTMYLGIFNNADFRSGIEISYLLIVRAVHFLNGDIIDVMFIYAALGVVTKFFIIFKTSSNDGSCYYYTMFIIMYFLSFIFVWEYIQIRAAVGISFFLVGVFSKKSKNKILFFIISCAFHYSMALPSALFLSFFYINKIKYKIICIPFVLMCAAAMFYLTPFAKSYSANNYMIDGKGIFSTQYCLVYLNLLIIFFFRKRITLASKEVLSLYFGAITIAIMMIVFNRGFPAFTDRLMDIATLMSVIPLFYIRNNGYKFFLFFYVIFFGLMRYRVVTSGLDPTVMNFDSFFSL